MSVATKNPFALLDDEDASRPSTPPPAPAQAAPPPTRGSQKPRAAPSSRGGKYYPRGGGAKLPPKDANQSPAEEPASDNQRKSEGGRARGRGSRGGGPGRGGRRPYDRHSQTGKTDSDKKLHQGWGGDDGNTELKAEEAATVDAAVEATPESPAQDAPEGTQEDKPEAARPRREREPEEEDTTLTLDQYLAQKKEKDTNVPKLEATRQANEGVGDEIWKDATVLTKNEDEESYFVGKTKSTHKARSKKEEKVFIEIDGRFDRSDRGRGRGRGDRARGGGGGGRGRGGARGGRQNGTGGPALDVDDQTAFPSLA